MLHISENTVEYEESLRNERKRNAPENDLEPIYTVEYIEKSREKKGKIYYYVKWCDSEEKTWEPAENILDAQLIIDFEKRSKTSQEKNEKSGECI